MSNIKDFSALELIEELKVRLKNVNNHYSEELKPYVEEYRSLREQGKTEEMKEILELENVKKLNGFVEKIEELYSEIHDFHNFFVFQYSYIENPKATDFVLEDKIKDTYHKIYQSDPVWKDIKEDITFKDAFEFLKLQNKDFYEFLGAGDSFVREGVFTILVDIINKKGVEISYDDIYNAWIDRPSKIYEISLEDQVKKVR